MSRVSVAKTCPQHGIGRGLPVDLSANPEAEDAGAIPHELPATDIDLFRNPPR